MLAACDAPPPAALTQEAYVWQRTWTTPVSAAVRSRELDLDGLRVLALQWIGEHRIATAPDLQALMARGLPLRLVLRIEGSRPRLPVATVAAAIRSALTEWQTHGLHVVGVEIDHDCASAGLDDYADWLSQLKSALPNGIALSTTALPSWLDNPAGLRALREVAYESVLQVHAVEARQTHLLDPDQALRWAADWQAHADRPFRIALPAYRLRVRHDALGGVLAVEGEGHGELGGNAAVERFALPEDVARVVRELAQHPPTALRGLVWFRLPVSKDRLGWSAQTLAHVMHGETPRAQIALLATARGDGLFDLQLQNIDVVDGLAPTHITLPAACGLVEGNGAFAASDSAAQLHASQTLWLAPEQRVAIGFARCAVQLPERTALTHSDQTMDTPASQ
ncbi:MAG: DUF3142 domain-containing protein [Lysobacteraceae bacterium]